MQKSILELINLSKSFRDIVAINDVSLKVQQGQIFGIIGPNGSGKTTILRTVLALIKPDSGKILLFNSTNIDAEKRRVGAVVEGTSFYPHFSVEKNLAIVALIKGAPPSQVESVLTTVGLSNRRKSLYKNLSLGMKQRLFIASVLLGDPDLLIFDEPTNGLDPTGIIEFRNLIYELNQKGRTILITSHLLHEIEKTCTHIAMLNKGSIVKTASIEEICNDFSSLEAAYTTLI